MEYDTKTRRPWKTKSCHPNRSRNSVRDPADRPALQWILGRWSFMCWCAVKKPLSLSQSLVNSAWLRLRTVSVKQRCHYDDNDERWSLTSAMRDDIGDTYDTSVIIYVFYGTVHVSEVSWYKPINDRSTVTMISTIISYWFTGSTVCLAISALIHS